VAGSAAMPSAARYITSRWATPSSRSPGKARQRDGLNRPTLRRCAEIPRTMPYLAMRPMYGPPRGIGTGRRRAPRGGVLARRPARCSRTRGAWISRSRGLSTSVVSTRICCARRPIGSVPAGSHDGGGGVPWSSGATAALNARTVGRGRRGSRRR
jgi:hypothetical protein